MMPCFVWTAPARSGGYGLVLAALVALAPAGRAEDCNGNGVPDDQELGVSEASPSMTPFGNGFPQSHTLMAPPPAGGPVTLSFAAIADFGSPDFEYVDVELNGTPIGRVFDDSAYRQCPITVDVDELVLGAGEYNALVGGGDAVFTMIASSAMDAHLCTASSIAITISYLLDDCDGNGVPDECDPDCNRNGVPDACDVDPNDPDGDGRVLEDCNANGVPDDCDLLYELDGDRIVGACDNCPLHANADQADCDGDGVGDVCAIADGLAADCDGNGVPDACELGPCDPNDAACADCNGNGVLDACEADCNGNGVPDDCDLSACDPNDPACSDCDNNGTPDGCDIAGGVQPDCNVNGVPDSCEVDCNGNGVPDDCDIVSGFSRDCDGNGIPDACDLANDPGQDCDLNGTFDACDIADGVVEDCNGNGIPDSCDFASGASQDCNGNELPDECDVAAGVAGDCDGDGLLDVCEIVSCGANDPACADCDGDGVPDGCQPDCDGDQIPDVCEIAQGTSSDDNGNGVPDECEDVSETVSFTAVDSDGPLGDAANHVLTRDVVGGFAQGRIEWNGVLTILEPQTLGGEAQLQVTHPSGVVRVFQLNPMSQTIGGGPTYNESGEIPQDVAPVTRPFGLGVDPAGTWTFRFFETVDDGAAGSPDSRWDSFELTLTDDPPPEPTPPAAEVVDISAGSATLTDPLSAGEVKWYRIEIGESAAAGVGRYLDLDTLGTLLAVDNDTELAIYDAWGYLLATNDDAAGTRLSRISLGKGAGGDGQGQHGDAFAGVHYIAAGGYNVVFTDGFSAASSSPYTGMLQLNIVTNAASGGTPLVGDTNGDCIVNVTDLAVVLANYGVASGAGLSEGDLTGDGAVNISDLSVVLSQYGATCPG